ncbi:hypothetical protein GpartN1_g4947.t1 [Galdieria partita]|uniref:Uncharacterized protein n=1 Tax=Galdieria partita TaxID=83374 RepID=A0A9C7Q0A7_9RHOD|nr:hypothetical protein GpartN1_g4947.t1 [Galdieria partita]
MNSQRSSETATHGQRTWRATLAFGFPTVVFHVFLSSLGWPVFRRHVEGKPQVCSLCGGYRVIPCDICSGVGKVKKGVFYRSNSIKRDSLVGSQWTAVIPVQGRRHFLCIAKKGKGKDMVAVLQTTCGRKESRTFIEVPLQVLKDRKFWNSGWICVENLQHTDKPCFKCKQQGVIRCPRCEGIGQVGL